MENRKELSETNQLRYDLLNDLSLFTRVIFQRKTGREFLISKPESNESHFITIFKELTDVFNLKTNRLSINCPPGWSKAIDIETPMFTRSGWKKASEVILGDELLGTKGWTTVVGVHPQGIVSAKKVFFSDKSSLVCNDDHKWTVSNRDSPHLLQVRTTSQLLADLYEADGRKKWRIPIINCEFGDKEPDIDPYLLGCWLGDGHSHYAAITTMDEEIVKSFEDHGYIMRSHTHQRGKATTYGIIKNGFSEYLRKSNQLKNKHFPEQAYWWSKENRLSLFQGLMDTDGTCDKNDGQASFCNKNKSILEGVKFLITSLGGTYITIPTLNGAFVLKMRMPKDIQLFKLARKQNKLLTHVNGRPKRLIKSISEVEKREMVCFTVDADDHLFAAGKDLVLTHNSELCKNFIAWAMAWYPDSKFLYISHSFELATLHTSSIKQTMIQPLYKHLFGVEIRRDSSAKDFFQTTSGGAVAAFGSGGGITGHDAGLPGQRRFTGAIIIDDIHKPDEVHSDTVRERIKRNYFETIERRLRSPLVPIILIGQRLHEDDLFAHLLNDADGQKWKNVVIKGIDDAGNARYPEVNPKSQLLMMKEKQPYVYASQYQQNPIPAGGGLFKTEWFPLLDESPKILATFVTCDTAETEKEYNDATVFSFWGLYQLSFNGSPISGLYGLHWLDCTEIRIEPKDLEDAFIDFWTGCMRYPVQPKFVAIEKKSTGVTLISVLNKVQGLKVIPIERSGTMNSKTNRFIEMQQYISSKQVSLPSSGKHTRMCIEHMSKITANNTHRHDDIADTVSDAVKMALIDKIIISKEVHSTDYDVMAKNLMTGFHQVNRLKKNAYTQ